MLLKLTIDDGLIVYGCRLLIPASMRPMVLANLHESHQGSARIELGCHYTGLALIMILTMLFSHVKDAKTPYHLTAKSQ